MRKVVSIFSIFVGFSMISMWIMLLILNQIPELKTIPSEIIMHIIIEIITAIMLITSGIGLSKKKKWSLKIYLFSSGMLFYTLVNSAGYYLQSSDYFFVAMFVLFLIIQLVILHFIFIKNRLSD